MALQVLDPKLVCCSFFYKKNVGAQNGPVAPSRLKISSSILRVRKIFVRATRQPEVPMKIGLFSFFAALLSPVLDGFDQLTIKLRCTVHTLSSAAVD